MKTVKLCSFAAIIGLALSQPAAALPASLDVFSFELNTSPRLVQDSPTPVDLFDSSTSTANIDPKIEVKPANAVCPAPAPKKKVHTQPPLINNKQPVEPVPIAANNNFCSPTLNINFPQILTAQLQQEFLAAQSIHRSSSPPLGTVGTTTDSFGDTNESAYTNTGDDTKTPAKPSSEHFKFKIGKLIEVELTSRSMILITVLIASFLVFASFAVIGVRQTAKTAPGSAGLIALAVTVLSAISASVALSMLGSDSKINEPTPNFQELLTAQATLSVETNEKWQALQKQLDELNEELRLLRQPPLLQPISARPFHDITPPDPTHLYLAVVFIFLTALLALAIAYRLKHAKSASAPLHVGVEDFPLPLGKIYKLENLTAQMIAICRNDEIYDSNLLNEKLAQVIAEINALSQHLESGHEYRAHDDEQSVKFEVSFYSREKSQMTQALLSLDTVLSSRHDLSHTDWRNNALKALANTRQSIISSCRANRLLTDRSQY